MNSAAWRAASKEARERGDYDAAPPSPEEAGDFLAGAADFLAVESMLDA